MSVLVYEVGERLDGAELRQYSRSVPAGGRVVVDLSSTQGLDGAALSALVTLYGRLRAEGGKLVLCGLNPRVREPLERTLLAKFIPHAVDQAQATQEARQ